MSDFEEDYWGFEDLDFISNEEDLEDVDPEEADVAKAEAKNERRETFRALGLCPHGWDDGECRSPGCPGGPNGFKDDD